MSFLFSSVPRVGNSNRRIVQSGSTEDLLNQDLFSYDDIGNIDYTGVEQKQNRNQSKSIREAKFSIQNRFPHFPHKPSVSRRRNEWLGNNANNT